MDLLSNEEALSVFLFLNRDSLDAIQLTTKRLKCIVAGCINDVCLRYFEYVGLSKSCLNDELEFDIRGASGSVSLKETSAEKTVDFLNSILAMAKHLRTASVGRLAIYNLNITSELVDVMKSISAAISVNKLVIEWIRFDVDFDVFHSMVLGFRSVHDLRICTSDASCVNDALLSGLATKGNIKFEQASSINHRSEPDRPRCGISELALLEFCVGERLQSGTEDRHVMVYCMHVSNEFFAKVIHASKQFKQGNNVEMRIQTISRIIQKFPPELQRTPVVKGPDGGVSEGDTTYNSAFVDGNPRKVTVLLVFHDIHARVPVRPCYRRSKRLPGRFYHDELIITFS